MSAKHSHSGGQVPFVMTVSGQATVPHPAERALINVVVSSSGLNKQMVSDEVMTTAKHVETMLRALSPQDESEEAKVAAPLAHWSKTSMSSTSYVPHNSDESKEAPRRYNASINFDIRFRNFKELGAFGTKLSALPHTEVQNIDWILTDTTQKRFHSELRKKAARDACQKAQDYAEALGCTNVRPIELSEGHLSSVAGIGRARAMQGQSAVRHAFAFGQASGGFGQPSGLFAQSAPAQPSLPPGGNDPRDESELEFKPEEIKMTLTINTTFHAE